jgi:competence protein ComEC
MSLSSNETPESTTERVADSRQETDSAPSAPQPYWLRGPGWTAPSVAPCLVYALAFTLGILLDRLLAPRLASSLLAALGGFGFWCLAGLLRRHSWQIVSLCLILGGLGAARHNLWLRDQGPLDVCRLTDERPRPIQVRGIIEQEPVKVQASSSDQLRTQPAGIRYRSILQVTERRSGEAWTPARGRVDLSVLAPLEGIHRGDEVELVGRLQAFGVAMNPGETDPAARAFARGVHSQIVVTKVAEAMTPLNPGASWSFARKLDQVRGYAVRQIERNLPPDQTGLADALLLGEDSHLSQADWDRYTRTGVVAVLVVSGQHLSLLAGWIFFVLCLANIPRQKSAIALGALLLAYSFLVGGQPPILRAAVMAAVVCGSYLVKRPVLDINILALAWLAVLIVNPTDLFSSGCQLSFISVAILFWAIRPWLRQAVDPLEKQIHLSRPLWMQLGLGKVRQFRDQYKATFVFCLALAPLVALNYHTFAWQAFLIGPLVVFFSELALMAGFVMLLTGPVLPPLAWLAARGLSYSLGATDAIVRFADSHSGSRIFFADLPVWWIWLFYLALAAGICFPRLLKVYYVSAFFIAWTSLGLLLPREGPTSRELRCTFLAVGHGGCAVIEMPDGRVILYDIGSIAGPEVARYHVQPFLWSRGIRKIDELILSHADLDHFNGLPELLDRFAVGKVTMTPTFANKETPGVHRTMEVLKNRGVVTSIVTFGAVLRAGAVTMRVLHPPPQGPPGPENVRSLVLLLQHEGHSILFTGDLEGAGRNLVLSEPIEPVDVLMAPHHGSPAVNDAHLANWANPKVVVSCEGPPRYQTRPNEPYSARGIKFFGTWPHGAITVRSSSRGLLLETFASEQRLIIRRD